MTIPFKDKHKTFSEFLESQIQLFKGHFLVTQASMDEEAIHQMRVAIKRIRAIQKLNQHIISPVDIPETLLDGIKTIFSISGKMRDKQIQTALLKHYQKQLKTSFSELEIYLQESESSLVQLLNHTIQAINFSKFNEIANQLNKPGEIFYDTDIETESLHFLQRKIEKIKRLIVLISDEQNVHELRKQIKQLFFILQFLSEQFPESVFYNYNLKSLKKSGDDIGFWNDRDIFKKMVEEYLSEQGGDFIEIHPEYQILLYFIDHEKRKLLRKTDLNLYLEMITLTVMLNRETVYFSQSGN